MLTVCALVVVREVIVRVALKISVHIVVGVQLMMSSMLRDDPSPCLVIAKDYLYNRPTRGACNFWALKLQSMAYIPFGTVVLARV